MSVEYLDPRADPPRRIDPYELSFTPRPQARVALLSNSFPDSDTFLRALAERLPVSAAGFREYRKPKESDPADEEMLTAIAGDSGAALAAYGH
jgi:hypothetical protein